MTRGKYEFGDVDVPQSPSKASGGLVLRTEANEHILTVPVREVKTKTLGRRQARREPCSRCGPGPRTGPGPGPGPGPRRGRRPAYRGGRAPRPARRRAAGTTPSACACAPAAARAPTPPTTYTSPRRAPTTPARTDFLTHRYLLLKNSYNPTPRAGSL